MLVAKSSFDENFLSLRCFMLNKPSSSLSIYRNSEILVAEIEQLSLRG